VTDKRSVSLSLSLSLWELCEGNLEGGFLYWELWKLGLKSTQRQAQKLILGFSPAAQTRILFFNRSQSRVVIGLFIGHSTLRRYFYLMGLTNIPLCRRCGAEEETSAHILCGCKALASLRHTYLGCFSWTQRMLRVSRSGPIWNFSRETELPLLGVRLWGTEGPSKGLGALELKGLEPNHLCNLI